MSTMQERYEAARTSIPNFNGWIETNKAKWERLARFYDTYGLPADILYLKAKELEDLPEVFENGQFRFVTSDELEQQLPLLVQMQQVGGWEKVIEHIGSHL